MIVPDTLRSGNAQRVALVTGASGGIGELVVGALAEAGFTVLAQYRSASAQGKAPFQRAAGADPRVVPLQADLASEADVRKMAEQMEAHVPAIECLVHAAAPPVGAAPPLLTTDDDFVRHLGVQASSFAALARSVLPLMQRQQRGVIVGLLSTVIEPSRPKGWWPYTAAKFAAMGLLSGLATDVEGSGVRVLGLMPSGVAGAMSKDAGMAQDKLLQPAAVAALIARMVSEPQPFPNGTFTKIEPSGVTVGRMVFQGTSLPV